MKKNMFIMTFLILTLSVFIPKVNAEIKTEFGTYPDLPYNSSVYLIKHNVGRTDSYADLLLIADSSCNISNVQYFAFQDSSSNRMLLKYCPYKFYKLVNGNWTFETNVSSGNTYPTFASFVNSEIATTVPIYSSEYNGYQMQGANTGFITTRIELIITQTSSTQTVNDSLNITLYDPDDEMGTGKVQYSYDNTNWEDTTLSGNGNIYNLLVYTNGNIYFRILDSNNNEIYTTTYEVTGLPTINGYQVYTIPSGNHNIYISNFSNSSGTFYIPPGYGNLTDTFYYLDSNGNEVGTQSISYNSYEENAWIPAYQMSEPSETLTGIQYDFTNYSGTKVLMFNFNSDKQLTFYIPNGLYLDYVNIANNDNFDCASETNISGTVTLQKCYVEYTWKDNNTTQTPTLDHTKNRQDLENKDFFSNTNDSINKSKGWLIGITSMFATFFNTLNIDLQTTIYLCIFIVIIVLAIRIATHKG